MSDVQVGMVLNETYHLEEYVAEGGMGTVFLARHVRLPKKRFAVKVLKGPAQDSEGYLRFRREAEIASELGHPNIIEVLDFNSTPDGQPYIVMPFLEGETLSERLGRSRRCGLADALTIVEQIAAGLQAAHEKGIVHRDIKPDNVFLLGAIDGPINCRILDFGISKIRDTGRALTKANVVMGTLPYMSPEQASGHTGEIDHCTDIFALGTLAHQLLTGSRPFTGAGPEELLDQIRYREPNLERIPKSVQPVLRKALAKSKRQRYQEVARFAKELRGALEKAGLNGQIPLSDDGLIPASIGMAGDEAVTEAMTDITTPLGGEREPSPALGDREVIPSEGETVDAVAPTVQKQQRHTVPLNNGSRPSRHKPLLLAVLGLLVATVGVSSVLLADCAQSGTAPPAATGHLREAGVATGSARSRDGMNVIPEGSAGQRVVRLRTAPSTNPRSAADSSSRRGGGPRDSGADKTLRQSTSAGVAGQVPRAGTPGSGVKKAPRRAGLDKGPKKVRRRVVRPKKRHRRPVRRLGDDIPPMQ